MTVRKSHFLRGIIPCTEIPSWLQRAPRSTAKTTSSGTERAVCASLARELEPARFSARERLLNARQRLYPARIIRVGRKYPVLLVSTQVSDVIAAPPGIYFLVLLRLPTKRELLGVPPHLESDVRCLQGLCQKLPRLFGATGNPAIYLPL